MRVLNDTWEFYFDEEDYAYAKEWNAKEEE